MSWIPFFGRQCIHFQHILIFSESYLRPCMHQPIGIHFRWPLTWKVTPTKSTTSHYFSKFKPIFCWLQPWSFYSFCLFNLVRYFFQCTKQFSGYRCRFVLFFLSLGFRYWTELKLLTKVFVMSINYVISVEVWFDSINFDEFNNGR